MGINRQVLLPQTAVNQTADDAVNDGEERNAQHHAGKAKQAAEEDDGEQYPEGRKAGAFAQDLGSQNVAVKLLQYEDENAREYCAGVRCG